MFDQISINQFKCFSKEQTIHLAPINVFYGKNGRGKSTVAQVFLLLGQTIQKGGASYLLLNGKMVRLGLFKDILSRNIEDDKLSFKFHLEEKNSDIIFEYQADQEKPTVGKLSRLEADGMNLMDFQTKAPGSGNEESQEVSLSAFSGHGLENFMNIYYVSASRRGQVNSEPRNDIDGKAILSRVQTIRLQPAQTGSREFMTIMYMLLKTWKMLTTEQRLFAGILIIRYCRLISTNTTTSI